MMLAIRFLVCVGVLACILPSRAWAQVPVGTAFTYQGRLTVDGGLVDADYDFVFDLYDAPAGGTLLGTDSPSPVPVTNGFFTVVVDFGTGLFTGDACWMEISVDEAGGGSPTTLTPRQELTPTPYSIRSEAAGDSQTVGGYAPGNSSGQVAVSNGNLCNNLDADKLDGQHATSFASGAHNHHRLNAADGSPTNCVYVNDDGFVGVYTSSPDMRMEIQGASPEANDARLHLDAWWNPEIFLDKGSSSADAKIHFQVTGSDRWVFQHKGITNSLQFNRTSTGTVLELFQNGNVHVLGNLTKGGGGFRIDHPLDPENRYLYHSFVESPDMMNVYNGNVVLDADGEAWVQLPSWFEELNRDFRYQLTCIGGFAPVYVAGKISGNQFKIAGGRSGLEVSWQVTGIRQDRYANENRIPIEAEKPKEALVDQLAPRQDGGAK